MSIHTAAPEAPSTTPVAGVSIVALIDRLDATLADLDRQDLSRLGSHAALDLVRRLAASGSRLSAVRLAAIAEVDRRGSARSAGATSTAAWLRGEGQSASAARRDVTLADALAEHTQTRQALADGRITPEHALVITGAVDALSDRVEPDERVKAEAGLLRQAQQQDPFQLRDTAKRAATRIDPHGSGDLAAAERSARARRELVLFRGRDGMHMLSGALDPEGAAVVSAALDPLAAPRPGGPEGADTRSPARRRADALVELARRALAGGGLPSGGGLRPQVMVTMTLEQLRGGIDTCAEVSGAVVREPISASTARRMACDAGVIPAVLGGPSEVLDLGRSSRTATPAQRRALALRDGGCTAPGCDRPPEWCEAHHTVPWSQGGVTDLRVMTLVCDAHHDLAHQDGWTVRVAEDGQVVWLPPPTPPPEPPW